MCLVSYSLFAQTPDYTKPLITLPTPSIPQQYSPFYKPPTLPNPPTPRAPTAQEILTQQADRQRAMHQKIIRESRQYRPPNFAMPNCMGAQGTESYRAALQEIKAMLEGEKRLDLGRATFLAENAFMKDSLDYAEFESYLNTAAQFLSAEMERQGSPSTSNAAKIMMLHRFFTDTMEVPQKGVHYPFTYDFEDPEADEDYRKYFATKLLYSGSGQCHSLPLLFLILAQKMGAEAYWTFSPNHSYLRFPAGGKWYNLELTNGHLTADSWIMGSSFVKAEALQHGLYMDTVSLKKALAENLSVLAMGYGHQHCVDGFVLEAVNTALEHSPTCPSALAMKSNYYSMWLAHATRQVGYPPPEQLHRFPEMEAIYDERNEMYRLLDEIGYATMTNEAYQEWLQSANDQHQEQQHRRMMGNFKAIETQENLKR